MTSHILRATGLYRKKLMCSARLFRRSFAVSKISLKPPKTTDTNENEGNPKQKEFPFKWEEYADLPPNKWSEDILQVTKELDKLLDQIIEKQKIYENKYGKYLLAAQVGIKVDPPLPRIRPEFMPLPTNIYDILTLSGIIMPEEYELSLVQRMKDKLREEKEKVVEMETEQDKSDKGKVEE